MENNFAALLEMAISEDQSTQGDITSNAIFSDQVADAVIISRQEACLAGVDYAYRVFKRIDPSIKVSPMAKDGQTIKAGDLVFRLHGPTKSLLIAERLALNFLAYLSGIATETQRHVQIAQAQGKTAILDTRKTLPGYRLLAKEAVRLGGGKNHRLGLYDMVLIKDNHIDAAGGIPQAVGRVRDAYGKQFAIELECRTLADVRQALSLAVDIIMLDNMNESDCAAAIAIRNTEFPDSPSKFEASGDMNPQKLGSYAQLGLDFVSIGRLTHSVSAVNFSMQIRS